MCHFLCPLPVKSSLPHYTSSISSPSTFGLTERLPQIFLDFFQRVLLPRQPTEMSNTSWGTVCQLVPAEILGHKEHLEEHELSYLVLLNGRRWDLADHIPYNREIDASSSQAMST